MELNERLTDVELNRLIWGLEAHGNMKRTLAGLIELRERRKAAEKPIFFVEIEGDDWINAGRIEGKERQDLGMLPDGMNFLYAAPQLAPESDISNSGVEYGR